MIDERCKYHVVVRTTNRGPTRRAGPGQELVFADCGICSADLHTSGAHGVFSVHSTHYTITNTSQRAPLTIWRLDNLIDRFAVAPDETMIIPFADAALAGTDGHVLTARAPITDADYQACSSGPIPDRLDPNSREYAILYALCEPLLSDARNATTPLRVIAERLVLSVRTVNRVIDQLVDRFSLSTPEDAPTGWRTVAVAKFALDDGILTTAPTWVPAPEAKEGRAGAPT